MSDASNDAAIQPGVLSLKEFCHWAKRGKTSVYRDAKAGKITLRKNGRSTVVIMDDALAYRAALPVAEIRIAA